MARLAIYKDSNRNTTAVSNRFIDEYMENANEAQLKVYLYLLRVMGANQATSVTDLADKFNHTEKEIIRSLKYWEKMQLLTLDYDATGMPTGIHFLDMETAAPVPGTFSPAATTVDSQPVFEASSDRTPRPDRVSQPAAPADTMFEKPVYTAEHIRAFKEREDTRNLLFMAETYMGRPLTPPEIQSLLFFTDVLHFSEDLIDYLIAYCVERGKKDFKYMEKVAVNWAESGVTTPRQAKKVSTRYDKNTYTIMNALGKNSAPTGKEAEYITRWTNEYGFDMDVILEACDRTVLATDRHRLEYAESILSSWHQENVHHKADIKRMDEQFQQKKASPRQGSTASLGAPTGSGSTTRSNTGNKFNQFQQNTYDFEALEKELLSN